ncbi:MAG TPA: hypothetical protein VLN59_16215 [Burkholderiales bacterium]|nr:hypothetical protein [Burkholderiales bacterium]
METGALLWSLPLAILMKAGMWLAILLLTLDMCPEALAVALQPPLLKCFPPGRQAVILAHLGAVAMASLLLVS